jgi:hypothetical protein
MMITALEARPVMLFNMMLNNVVLSAGRRAGHEGALSWAGA